MWQFSKDEDNEQHSFLFRLCGKGSLYPAIPHIYSSVGYCIVYSSWVSHNLLHNKRNSLTLSFCINPSFEVGGTTLPKMKKKSKLDELLDIIRPVIAKGVKCQSNKGDVEINKTGTISEISHEPSNMDESYADEWTKVICKGEEFELKWHIPATEEDNATNVIKTANMEFSVSIQESNGIKTAKLIAPITITFIY